MTGLDCLVHEHNIWLVLVAVAVCCMGSWVTARLFLRTTITRGMQQFGWHFLTALSAGVAIWCTHFIAMLGFKPGTPVSFDPILSLASLLIAITGSTIGFVLAGSRLARIAPVLGGMIVGLAISAMHYTGMMAYQVQGTVSWDKSYVITSIVLSVVLSAISLHFAMRPGRNAGNIMAGVFGLAIAVLHFTGMAAFHVKPLQNSGAFSNAQVLFSMAIAVAGMSFVIVAAGLVSYLIDDSTRAETMESLRRMAMNDTLTSLPNRASLNEQLDHEIDLAREQGSKFALIGIDLNRFKETNDMRGHHAGDEVLRTLGRRIKDLLYEDNGEFVARIGGDEFIAIRRIDDTNGLSDFLSRLEAALFKPIRIEDFDVTTGASFGVAIWPDDATDKETLLNNADLAMYRAKNSLTQKVRFYEPSLDEAVRTRRALLVDLREALASNQLSVYYQVQKSSSADEIRGYEALLRWKHPRYGFIPPSEFIPIAEENGLILQIGEWVLREACSKAVAFDPPCRIAVNLSAVQLIHSDLPNIIKKALMETGLAPERLEVELTESVLFADKKHALHILRQIKDLGVSVALDDFGTGYSSLDTLLSFPFDRVKLDKLFMNDSTQQGKAIVRAVLALGKSLHIPVLAEGIETEEQLSMLHKEGCDEVQGFLLGRPVPLDEIIVSGQVKLIEN